MSNPPPKYMQLAKARLEWARTRIDEFIAEADEFLAKGPFEIARNVTQQGEMSNIKLVLMVKKQILRTLRFRAGDAIHNLRAVVDNMIDGLAEQRNSSHRFGLEFHETAAGFSKTYAGKIACLPVEIQNWIANEQPHNRTKGPSLLHILNRMWNADKHRAPSLVAGAIERVSVGVRTGSFYIKAMKSGDFLGLKDGDKIIDATIPARQIMHFAPNFALDISFNKGSAAKGAIVRTFLNEAHKHILNEVIPKFEPFL